ncbi:SAG-related sequence SRS28 [Toxoplasma gondii ME49]|uniref:SRS28 n=14 Tax=Toxoplasma gondii TaxID=5811 RepID=B9PL31_TOXGV|nr:SAG-related sequence SRS28 [Toxoplasma gondii ME49]EPR62930.1 SAG-related sequence SRS28 [Toxoplasma gondii GT1]ESS32206.1 SAG-related sequence SRS28 [Toxoplasma gondii VEG]KAF4641342.1 SAG-related sequence SRS28 [Toxoplasma gondii]KFG29378.1 SAG-related sequence SRS28 [Toxoplasma gondii p89]KFG33806.1 SAG-related sequence SRS28 [Toxoplasma gondii GAB2-2007-GAL-DOM2]KFG38002.1 SAG-related sequence SRS28 [Toxoplasma gondii FOU]KFG65118.1 SAG-related sequence SRS28 [Toxoplasma gondii RUB]K|eukprot:XP_002365069.1 SAG-related sequence SRS28 [Toxoplasma gondii ME49]
MSLLSRVAVLSVVALSFEMPMMLAADPEATSCETEGSSISFTVEKAGHVVRFNCPSTLEEIKPAYEAGDSTKVCTTADCSNEAALKDVLKSASLAQAEGSGSSGGNDFTLTVDALPEAETSVFFLCQRTGASRSARRLGTAVPSDKCGVHILVKAAPQAPVCSAQDHTLELQITAANSDTSFVCGGTFNVIKPANAAKVLQGDSCETEVDLVSLVPHASRSALEQSGLIKLSVTDLPQQQQKLCYRCEDSSQKACKVLVTVSASHTSDAARLTAQAALGALLAVAGLVYMA